MPVQYERGDAKYLVTVTVTDPYTLDEIFDVIDRQAAENTWEYALLFDLQAVATLTTRAEGQRRLMDRVRRVGGARQRGPVGLALAPRPDDFSAGLQYTQLTSGLRHAELAYAADLRSGVS